MHLVGLVLLICIKKFTPFDVWLLFVVWCKVLRAVTMNVVAFKYIYDFICYS